MDQGQKEASMEVLGSGMKRMGEAVCEARVDSGYISMEISPGPNEAELSADLTAKLIISLRSFKTVFNLLSYWVLNPLSYCI